MKHTIQIQIGRVTFFFLLVVLQFSIEIAYGQSNCPNSNFSMGDFTYWQGYYGTFNEPGKFQGFVTTGVNPRHLIIKSPGTKDENTCGGLSTIPPGELFSARLGNSLSKAEAEQLCYTLPVTIDNNLFIYKYAVVLQDPGHTPSEQPSFTIEVKDKNGVLFDPVCGYYYVYAQQNLPTWSYCDDHKVVWKDWTTVGLDLSKFIGQTVTIVFTTRDCKQSGHFGYAYISTACAKLEMSLSYCANSTSAILSAPPGFSYLWSNGLTTQTIEINNPVAGTVYSCLLTSVNGCQVTIRATIKQTLIKPNFNYVPLCLNSSILTVSFADSSSINQNTIVKWKWDFGDNTPLVAEKNPTHSYALPGKYNVKLVTYSSEGCKDSIIKPVDVNPLPVPIINGSENNCVDRIYNYTTEASMQGYQWNISAGGTIVSGEGTNSVKVIWNTIGAQTISVSYSNQSGCKAIAPTIKKIVVNTLPTPTITGTGNTCVGENYTYTTEPSMSDYLWNVSAGGTIISGGGTNSITVKWNAIGNQTVSVNYSNQNACTAIEPTRKDIVTNALPKPAIACSESSVCVATKELTYTTEASMSGYLWTVSTGGVITSDTRANIIKVKWNEVGTQKVTVNYINSNGCTAKEATVSSDVIVYALPIADFVPSSNEVKITDPLIEFVNKSQHAIAYKWNFGDSSEIVTDVNPKHLFNHVGYFNVSLTAINEKDCSEMSSQQVAIIFEKLYPPTVISPNSSNKEDREFRIYAPGVSNVDYKLKIFNRWGEVIFESQSQENGWDGTMKNGNVAPSGVYTWTIEFRDFRGEPYHQEGNVTLLYQVDETVGRVYPPTAFSPNSTNEEDRIFRIYSAEISNVGYRMLIYNRWGENIFESLTQEKGWDGKMKNGESAPSGVYVWSVDYIDTKGNPHTQKGSITLLY